MAEVGWGKFADVENVGTPYAVTGDFKELSFEEATCESYKDFVHAAHGMIYTQLSGKLWDLFPLNATALMQIRFDGLLGFPGGLVDAEDPCIPDALNRECIEEIGLNLSKFRFKQEHHVVSHINSAIKLVTHFYCFEVSETDFGTIEKETLNAKEWGIETFGIIRIPMFITGDGLRGFPVFLANKFAGNAKQQLVIALKRKKILENSFLDTVLEAALKYEKEKLTK